MMLLATTLLLAGPLPAWAQSGWTGAVSSDWFDPGNWTNGVPDAADNVNVDTSTPNPAVISGGDAFADWLLVAQFGSSRADLTLTNGGTLTSVQSRIGNDIGSVGAVTVRGAGSVWNAGFDFLIGTDGSGTLTIADGGTVNSTNRSVLGFGASAQGNVTVTGAGSTWNHSGDLVIGIGGDGDLSIEDGGVATTGSVVLGSGDDSLGSASVAGAGSSWTTGSLVAGHFGTGSVRVSDGGRLSSTFTVLGNGVGGSGGSVVTGAGSAWNVTGALIVGNEGLGSLVITNRGTVASTAGAAIGNGGGQGTVSVLGAGSAWNVVGGLTVGVAGTGYFELLGGALVADSVDVGEVGSGVGSVTLRGDGSDATIGNELVVGDAGTGTLLIAGRGALGAGGVVLGQQAGAQGTLTVSDAGSLLTHTGTFGEFVVGLDGSGALAITAGGTVDGAGNALLGAGTGSGQATVTGAGAQWRVDGSLVVGANGSGTLSVAEGGRVEAARLDVGNNPGGTGTATVDGGGSVMQLQTLGVAAGGSGSLEITGGALVESALGAAVGAGASDSVGAITVTGAGSRLSTGGTSYVGSNRGEGRVDVLAGGVVDAAETSVGHTQDAQGTIHVSGAGSRWQNSGMLTVGNNASGTLSIGEQGVVESGDGWLGNTTEGRGTAIVEGPGSAWNVGGNLFVGVGGSGTLDVTAGGIVVTGNQGVIGYSAGSTGTVAVTGPDSAWTLHNALQVGRQGAGELVISNGGAVHLDPSGGGAAPLLVGSQQGATGTMTVTGAGSAWQGRDGIIVADAGTGALTVENGGVVSDQSGILGNSSAGVGTAVVRGAGSQWNSTGPLWVGRVGSGALAVEAGGRVASADGTLGLEVGGVGTATVTGAGSTWTNAGDMLVGQLGTAVLTVADGGAIDAAEGIVIANLGGSTGTVNIGAAAGDAAVAAGDIEAPSIAFGAGTGTLNLNHTDSDYVLDAALTGTGTIDAWSGTTSLAGAGDAGGALNVRGGTLRVEGTLGAMATTVLGGATLGGSGRIGGDVAVQDGGILAPGSSAGTLTLGSLSLSAGSLLNYELGQAGVIGGGVNDLIEVGGDLVLDGTLEVTDIGGFGAGVYRLMNYGGTLTDNGLELGALPTGSDTQDLFVQTGIAGQVNLVNSAGLTLSFWDGAVAGQHNNGAVDGGAGAWDAGNDNWTAADGALNGRWDDGTFAVFGGTGGDVSVVGEQAVAGMQFMSGYTLAAGAGGALRIDGAESVVRVDPGITAQVAAPIVGAGGLVKTDTGTLVLSGENTYAGGTRVDRGTLQVSRDANLGDAAGALTLDGGTLHNTEGFITHRDVTLEQGGGTFQVDTVLTLAGTVSGEGRLTKTGRDTLILSNANGYAGGTEILEGHITARATGALGTGPVRVDGATLLFAAEADAGTLDIASRQGRVEFIDGSSAGDATIRGEGGSLTFAGNASAGSASIDSVSGAVRFFDASTADGASIVNGAGSVVDISGLTSDGLAIGSLSGAGTVQLGTKALRVGALDRDDAIAGVIAGDGALVKQGAGTLTLTGANTFTGGTTVNAGTLRLGDGGTSGSLLGDVAVAADSTFVFDRSDDIAFAGVFSGAGAVDKLGAGTLTLGGGSSAFAGTTTISAGTLRMDGTLGGLAVIASGARLTGTGTLGSVDIAGTVAAGNSIGTLTLTGDYTHRDGAMLEAEIEPGGTGDLLDVAGSATIEGGTVDVVKAPGQYAGGTRYTLIDAAGGVTGTFGALEQDLPFLDLLLAYDAHHVYLDVTRSEVDFDIVCGEGTFNQCEVAGALDRIGEGGTITPDLETVLTELTTLDLDQARAGFDRLSGEAHASLAGAMLEGHALYGRTVTRRLAARREAEGADRLHGGVWARGYGMGSELDGNGNAHGANLELYGLAVGADAWATEAWLVGASLNTLKLDADFREGDGGEADASNLALYTSVQGERGYLDAVASYAWWDAEVQRRIEVGDIVREARSDYGTHRFAAYVEAGLTYDVAGGTLQPLLSAEWSLLSTGRFRETGADDLDLLGSAQDVERTVASAGLRWTGEYGSSAWTFAPTAQARWLHAFGDLEAAFGVAFAGAPDEGYRVRGVAVPEDRGLLGVGVQASRDDLDLFLDLDYQAGDGFEAASFGAGLRWRW